MKLKYLALSLSLLVASINAHAVTSMTATMNNGMTITTTVDPDAKTVTYSWDFSSLPGAYEQLSFDQPGFPRKAWCPSYCVVGAGLTQIVISEGGRLGESMLQLNYEGGAAPARLNSVVLKYDSSYEFTGDFIDGSPLVAGDDGNVKVTFRKPLGGEDSTLWAYTPQLQLPATDNTAPTANAGADQSVTVNALVTLDGSGSTDPDANPMTYRWALNVPNGSTTALSNASVVNPSFIADVAGTYIATLTVNDGFLDSSVSDVSVLVGALAKPTLVSPTGSVSSSTPTYEWEAVQGASWYYLWVNDNSGTPIKKWFKATDANCAAGSGRCSVTPATPVIGTVTWWVLAWNKSGYGPWSSVSRFDASQEGVPGRVSLVAPWGNNTGNLPTYSWKADANATQYILWVEDSAGNVIKETLTSDALGCGDGTGMCLATPLTAITGSSTWWVMAQNVLVRGKWSAAMRFTP